MTDKQNKSSVRQQASEQAEEDPLVRLARIRKEEQEDIARDLKELQELDKAHAEKVNEMQRAHARNIDAIRKGRRW